METTYPVTNTLLTIEQIKEMLPHRYPFLLVDKVISINLEKNSIVAQKNVTYNEEFFQGHFPGVALMPGVLILEAIAQTAGILLHQKGYSNKIAVFLNISQAKFRNPVKPADVLYLHAEVIHVTSKGGKMKGRAIVGDKLAAEVEFAFALRDKSQI